MRLRGPPPLRQRGALDDLPVDLDPIVREVVENIVATWDITPSAVR